MMCGFTVTMQYFMTVLVGICDLIADSVAVVHSKSREREREREREERERER